MLSAVDGADLLILLERPVMIAVLTSFESIEEIVAETFVEIQS